MIKQTQQSSIYGNDNFKAIPTTFYTSTHMHYVNEKGENVVAKISSDFKLVYGYLFDQYRSFSNQGRDFHQDWETIFSYFDRKYVGDKTSLQIVKTMEDAGIIFQTKRTNTNSTNKIVKDITIMSDIKFSNERRDTLVAQIPLRNDKRRKEYKNNYYEKDECVVTPIPNDCSDFDDSDEFPF